MVLGCDIGTAFTKAVLMEDGKYLCGTQVPTEANPDQALQRIGQKLFDLGEVKQSDVDRLVVTGWGQSKVSRDHQVANMVKALTRAALWNQPECRSVLCLGAQQSVAIVVNPKGRIVEYKVSDKCASGAGKFVEIIIEALGCTLEETSEVARRADKELTMSSQCAVFAESEVVSLINEGESVANILKAIFQSLSQNLTGLYKRVRGKEVLTIGGGLANNELLVELLQERIPVEMQLFEPGPSYMAAIGAALCVK